MALYIPRHGKRDAMYKVATFLVSHFWGKPHEMADSLGVLLLTWNQAFYRYGVFSFDKLEKSLSEGLDWIESYRERDILSLKMSEEREIRAIFIMFWKTLQIEGGKSKGKKSPVAAAKTLHLLAPKFFPIWDDKIAKAYQCYYSVSPSEKYFSFCGLMKELAESVQAFVGRTDKSLLKLIDQYNYSKYTKKWI